MEIGALYWQCAAAEAREVICVAEQCAAAWDRTWIRGCRAEGGAWRSYYRQRNVSIRSPMFDGFCLVAEGPNVK
ncbi:ethylene-responsive transcription factor RAP2-12-like [Gossypium australe]|uniref:Ethylene-responsive transcription factor RAP2-12-like n=1 Tax=Gossypium australe TaxID=47621 RepID=A0A5B6WD35_9ROSI|nr:ethylene-responsive transcription factor RAP2-12-like [Gossypium australe]